MMSRKMLSRDRYPRDASLYSNHAPVTQVSQSVASTSLNYTQAPEVPLYNPQSVQQFQNHQNFQNSWQTGPAPLFSSQQSHVQNSWPCEPQYSQAGSSENNVWNWTPESNMPNHGVQPIPEQQQFHHSEIPAVSQYPGNATTHSYYATETMPSVQPANMNYSTQNDWYAGGTMDCKKLNGNKPVEQIPQTTWDTMSTNISQAEHLPWTYSVPQNTVTAAENMCEWSNSSFSQSAVSYSDVTQNFGKDSWQEIGNSEYRQNPVGHASTLEQTPMVQDHAFVPYQAVPSQHNTSTSYGNSTNSVENVESCVPNNHESDFQLVHNVNEVMDSENSGLNAFFHHSVEENVEVAHENPPCETVQESHVGQACGENVTALSLPDLEIPVYTVNQLQDENTETGSSVVNNEVQDCESKAVPSSETVPAALPAEEPLNQEVPEPFSVCSTVSSQQANKENIVCDDSPDEPLNQQIPAKAAVPISTVEWSGAGLEENSPFKPPVKSSTTGSIVQQENASKGSFLPKSVSQGGFQEVNLETVPDNLERPPDYDDLRKESSLSASFRQHLRSMEKDSILDTSKASLWEDPNLPCVLLAPAVPLQHEAPSLLNVNTSQTAESKSAVSITSSLQDLHIKAPVALSPLLPSEEKSHSTSPSPAPILRQASPSLIPQVCSAPVPQQEIPASIPQQEIPVPISQQEIPAAISQQEIPVPISQVANPATNPQQASPAPIPHQASPAPIPHQASPAPIPHQASPAPIPHQASPAPIPHQASPAPIPHQASPAPLSHQASPIPYQTNPAPIANTCRAPRETAGYNDGYKADSSIVKGNPEYAKASYESLKTDRSRSGSPVVQQTSPVKEPRQAMSSMDMTRREHYPPPHSDVERDRHSRSYTDMRGKPTPDFDYDPHNSRHNYRSLDQYPEHRSMDSRYSSFDERRPSFNKEGSRPSSRMSLDESMESHASREHNYRKNYNSDYDRPPSRMSESEAYRAQREGYPPYFDQRYNNRGSYSREEEYYRTRGYKGYEYDPYQAARPYYGYYDPYRYSYSSYNYGFYDELYRDPRYRKQMEDQYREYYKRLGYETDYERSSAYSGRSSANELSKDVSQRYPENDASSSDMQYQNYEQESQLSSYEASDGKDSTPVCRLTPAKFSSPHAFVNFTPSGQLLRFVPAKSMSGVPPLIEIHNMQALCQNTPSQQEIKQFQGPLVRRETHKNDIIDFCVKKVKFYKQKQGIHDRESYILLWELLILLLRQNGSVAGSDIAELLLKDHEVLRPPLLRHTSDIPQSDSSPADTGEVPTAPVPAGDASSPDEGIVVTRDKTILNSSQCFDMDKVTRKFREFLLFGHKKDALEWAMKHNLWGHALFLASKMDVRTYANVMTRFANSLALNDPLQTLYQLMSGRQPAAVTCVADKQWGDWRPHLAMILSNPSSHSEVDFKSITTLGDTLAAQGCLPATHFCYLMAQVEFGNFSCKSSKMVLLLGDHQLPFNKFATNEAIQCTEIYEYAQSLANPGFILNHLQTYKFIYATRLADNGFLQEALHYCEVLTTNFLSNPSAFPTDLIQQVYELALRLKYNDPHYLQGLGELEEQEDPDWLKVLASLLCQVQQNQSYNQEGFQPQSEAGNNTDVYQQNSTAEVVPERPSAEVHDESYSVQPSHNAYSNAWITGNILQPQQQQQYSELSSYEPQFPQQEAAAQNQPSFTTQWNMGGQKTQEMYYENKTASPHDEIQSSPQQTSPSQKFNFYGSPETQMPMHSIHSKERTSSTSSIGLAKDRRDSALSSGSDFGSSSKTAAEVQKPSEDKSEKPRPQVGRSWLGGIFSKLLPKGPNQMILPDDKNPTIVWDPLKNRWINTDSKEEDVSAQPSAPPRDNELLSKIPEASNIPVMPPVAATSSPLTNKFQRQKVKGMRQNYVDILNPTSSTETPATSGILFPTMPTPVASAKMLVPTAPVSDDHPMDFVSTQSYSYTATQGDMESVPQAPPMFDPAEFDSRPSNINTVRHSIGSGHRTYPT